MRRSWIGLVALAMLLLVGCGGAANTAGSAVTGAPAGSPAAAAPAGNSGATQVAASEQTNVEVESALDDIDKALSDLDQLDLDAEADTANF